MQCQHILLSFFADLVREHFGHRVLKAFKTDDTFRRAEGRCKRMHFFFTVKIVKVCSIFENYGKV